MTFSFDVRRIWGRIGAVPKGSTRFFTFTVRIDEFLDGFWLWFAIVPAIYDSF